MHHSGPETHSTSITPMPQSRLWRRLLCFSYSPIREAVVEDVLLHAPRPCALSAQRRARLPQESDVGQRSQRDSNSPRARDKGKRLHQKAARFPTPNRRPIGVSVPDEWFQRAAVVDRYDQLCVRFVLGTTAGGRCWQPKTLPEAIASLHSH